MSLSVSREKKTPIEIESVFFLSYFKRTEVRPFVAETDLDSNTVEKKLPQTHIEGLLRS
jgi:hypothetical protein